MATDIICAGMTNEQIIHIHGLSQEEMRGLCADLGAAPYRAKQLWRWLYHGYVTEWAEMKNVPAELRTQLSGRTALDSVVAEQTEGDAGATRKVLLRLLDGERIEEVLIPARERNTVCVSSQVGCRFNCSFCASGKAGFRRNLAAGEMVAEVVMAARLYGARPSHVVFMGIGEPLDNYDEVLKAIRIINDPDGLCIGARRITISTCGVIPGLQRLADEDLQVELSVSLHVADDALRTELMPVNKKYPLSDLMAACAAYVQKTKRIITFEYTLVKGVNDSPAHAEALAKLIRPMQCRVNLIPLSPVSEFPGEAPPEGTAEMFVEKLGQVRINSTVRVSKGSGLNAACGQLRLRELKKDVLPSD
jgi:23S rRNA (adenine2503-C2)-methyltransferase